MNVDKNLTKEDILENIELPDNLEQLVIDSVEKGYEHMKQKKEQKQASMVKRAAIILGITAAAGVISVPVKAFVTSLVQERMEQIPPEKINDSLENLDAQQTEADSYSREYTSGEKERLADLSQAYNQGTFPQNEVRQEKTADQTITGELYFAQDTSTFYLPARELTDEEILQIIDFATKRDYAVTQRYEQEEGAERNQQQQEAKKELAAAGGLTEEQAKELGKEWLQKLYGETGEGMELSFYLDEKDNKPVYMIGYYLRSIRNCTALLDAQDGSLISTHETMVTDDMETVVSIAAMEEKTDTLYQTAKETLVNQLGLKDEYEKVIMAYHDDDGKLGRLNSVCFIFVKSDGSAHEITISAVRGKIMAYQSWESYEACQAEKEAWIASTAVKNGGKPKGRLVYKEIP